MKCMIVEDESPAVKILQNHIDHFSDLELVGIHHNAIDAFTSLQQNVVDILFLDIELPKMSGIELLKALQNKPAVIMTTAYREFALEGYDLEITDYLLKPISFERFTKAIAKVYKSAKQPMEVQYNSTAEESLFSRPFIYIKTEREYRKVLLEELLFVESIKNHVKLVTEDSSSITLMSLAEIEERLPRNYFLRIHRSFIVSLSHISRFGQTHVVIKDKVIPVGRHYKQQFIQWVEKNTL